MLILYSSNTSSESPNNKGKTYKVGVPAGEWNISILRFTVCGLYPRIPHETGTGYFQRAPIAHQ
jgi:hypothetical protein